MALLLFLPGAPPANHGRRAETFLERQLGKREEEPYEKKENPESLSSVRGEEMGKIHEVQRIFRYDFDDFQVGNY
ncbi:MAG: hypothetical protein QMD05_08985, partial [Candidatus Brocadiaceae bacterium]|nr:hypothetical protein [Candidatus Brocadiaceae bacterium]